MQKKNIEIVICTEAGYLESLSKLLVATIREFGGSFYDVPIYSYSPRINNRISRDTIRFFEKNCVEYVDLDLNKDFRFYPLANKPISCAHREKNTTADILVFLDSDVIIAGEPGELADFHSNDVILRPVDNKNIGAENAEDQNAVYWEDLYRLLSVKVSRYVKTTVTNVKILEYYNTGHISAQTKTGLFRGWNDNFIKVMKAKIIPAQGIRLVEQSVFSATVSQMELSVKHLSKEYNFPVHKKYPLKNTDYRVDNLADLVSVHYHDMFRREDAPKRIKRELIRLKHGGRILELIEAHDLVPPEILRKYKRRKLKKKVTRWLTHWYREAGAQKTISS